MLESVERITPTEINQAFFDIAGYAPIDESSILLQRLPFLGRIGTGGTERIFVDAYAKDGLRGIALADSLTSRPDEIKKANWVQPLCKFGIQILMTKFKPDESMAKMIKIYVANGNNQVGCDYIQFKLLATEGACDFGNLSVKDGSFDTLTLSEKRVSNLNIFGCDIENMEIENSDIESVILEHCTIKIVDGIGGVSKLPDVFRDCLFGEFRDANSVSRISELKLSDAHLMTPRAVQRSQLTHHFRRGSRPCRAAAYLS